LGIERRTTVSNLGASVMAKPTYVAGRLTGVAIYELPASFSREIGKIVVRWAYFEHCVQEMNWGVLNLSPAAGRIAIREPRVTDRLEMLQELIALRKGLWDEELYKSILSRARLASAKRDLLAHGIWGLRATDRVLGSNRSETGGICRSRLGEGRYV
jgi:hypothetical protein